MSNSSTCIIRVINGALRSAGENSKEYAENYLRNLFLRNNAPDLKLSVYEAAGERREEIHVKHIVAGSSPQPKDPSYNIDCREEVTNLKIRLTVSPGSEHFEALKILHQEMDLTESQFEALVKSVSKTFPTAPKHQTIARKTLYEYLKAQADDEWKNFFQTPSGAEWLKKVSKK